MVNVPPLLMVTGHLCDGRIFSETCERLEAPDDVRIFLPPDASDVDDMAKSILDDAPDYFAIAGFSLGGMIAMSMLEQDPARVLGAALISTDPYKSRNKEIDYRKSLLDASRTAGHGVYVDAMLANFFVHEPSAAAKFGPNLREMMMSTAPRRLASEAKALSTRKDRLDAISRFDRPVEAIVGVDDRLCPPSLSAAIVDAAPQGRLSQIAGAGHIALIETPAAVAAALDFWLDRVASEAPT